MTTNSIHLEMENSIIMVLESYILYNKLLHHGINLYKMHVQKTGKQS